MATTTVNYDRLRHSFAGPGEKLQLQLIDSLDITDSSHLSVLADMWDAEAMPSVLRWVARGLSKYPSSAATSCVRQALKHPSMSVRLHAVSGIWKNNRTDLLPDLRSLVTDSSGSVRLRTLSALSALRAEGMGPLLQAALADPKEYVRRFAQNALSSASESPTR